MCHVVTVTYYTLSEQMLVALPIVSHAASTRMRFWSLYIFLVEYASEIVTARGSPCTKHGTHTQETNKKVHVPEVH